ncbi:membrane protein required for colicin V production [Ciceribacter lividus]|uniref:Membrane protein required for colicin V production n=1 Tax=Ciceribacter lividus TaxID=1197950 RepID=A0A6I7HSC0_9HYPH|nr:CvpA family protein [Ciceribacter lividus]RCW27642.1 membrane protein required for colicin V production [Ciceribacter lividus]
MPITIFDGIVIGVVLFSAVLAMVRGFSREVLSIASWVGAVAAAYYLHPLVLPYIKNYTSDERIALAGAAGIVFLIALIVISFITTRIADFIIDSRIGALDRTLGFLFGAARGILLLVVAVAFWNWLIDVKHRPDWVNNAKSKPFLDALVLKLEAVLPEDIEPQLRARILGKEQADGEAPAEQAPADQAPAGQAAPSQTLAPPAETTQPAGN